MLHANLILQDKIQLKNNISQSLRDKIIKARLST
jgi:hypothetical protein